MGAGVVEVADIEVDGAAEEAVAQVILRLDDGGADQRFLEELEDALDAHREDDEGKDDGDALEAIVGQQHFDVLEHDMVECPIALGAGEPFLPARLFVGVLPLKLVLVRPFGEPLAVLHRADGLIDFDFGRRDAVDFDLFDLVGDDFLQALVVAEDFERRIDRGKGHAPEQRRHQAHTSERVRRKR